jgi:hypothetical protein
MVLRGCVLEATTLAPSIDRGSCCFSKGRIGIGDPVKSIAKPGAERAIIDGAALRRP